MTIKHKKLQEFNNQIEKGLDYNELIELRKKVYNIKTEMYSDEWYEKHFILRCIKEILDESKLTKEQKEQEVLKEFEEIGFVVTYSANDHIIYLRGKYGFSITINKSNKGYAITGNMLIYHNEHQLLHKLFELWGWFDE